MDFECFKTEEESDENEHREWTISEVYFWRYGWAGCYDNPWDAWAYGDVTSPRYCGGDFWEQWKHEHWVGRENVEERALADPFVRKHLKSFGLLDDDEGGKT